ncbi:MAG: 30S ribosomal protein S17 [Parcubacteria group bacterium CG11_big_fil_rev_8_21_14_0_20_39_22]|nr:MAG: 30S ribosomal protein S17 [Parcubacteria group bacterium CG11_big_fil_rev_8_21_14_0_20_39_22]
MTSTTDTKENKITRPRRLTGVVVSAKMKDTIVVSVDRFVKHPKYGKYMTITDRYKADDKGNTKQEGEKVTIEETAPISKDKKYKVVV